MPIFDMAFRAADGRRHGELAIADDAESAIGHARRRLGWILGCGEEGLQPLRCQPISAAEAAVLAPLLDEDDRLGTPLVEALP